MSKGMNSLAAGAAVALAAGTAVYLFSGKKRRTVKKLKRSAGKAMKVMEDLAGQRVLHDEIVPKTRCAESGGFIFCSRMHIFLVSMMSALIAIF